MTNITKFLLPATIGSLLVGGTCAQGSAALPGQSTNCPVVSQITGECGNLNSLFGQNGSCDLESLLNELLGNTGNCNSNQGTNSGCNNQGSNNGTNTGNNNQSSNKGNSSQDSNKGSSSQDSNKGTTGSTEKTPETNGSLTSTEQSYISQVVKLVNEERAKYGLSALTYDSTLQSAAQLRAEEIVKSFSHTRPNGTYFSTVFKEFNISYRTGGENIAWGQKTPSEVVTAWMNSSGHRANILNANYNKIGVGCNISSSGTIYWSQLFTN